MSSTTQQQQSQQLPNILFLGGGNMASAIIGGLITSETYQTKNIYVMDIIQSQLDSLKAKHGSTLNTTTSLTQDLFNNITVIILSIKPTQVPTILEIITPFLQFDKHIIVSICAGIPTIFINQLITQFHSQHQSKNQTNEQKQQQKQNQQQQLIPIPILRVMPNTPALIQAGASGICKGKHASNNDINLITKIMSSVGLVVQVTENDIDAVTGVSGSGPAYVITFIEALTAGGVASGLSYPISYQLALETVYGTSKMLKDLKQHPAIFREQICSPGGTTITGLTTLHEHNFNYAIMQCVLNATSRGTYLANKTMDNYYKEQNGNQNDNTKSSQLQAKL